MAMSLSMLTLVFTVVFIMAHTTFSQQFDRYSLEVPEDVNISPMPDFDIYVETPDESLFEADSPTMEYNMKLGRQYSDKQFNFLQICLQKLNSDCGDNIVKNMLDKTTTQLTNECCLILLKIGKDCQLGVAHIISSNTEYNNIASKAIPKSKHTWKDCVRRENMAKSLSMLMFVFTVVSFMSHTIFSQEYDYSLEDVSIPPIPDYIEAPSQPQVSYYTDEEFAFLQDCLKKVETDYCGAKILKDMLDETTTPLTIGCCRDLLKIGRDCHLVVAKYESVPQNAFIDPSASNAVAKSKYTWKDCVRRIESYIGAPEQSQEFDRYSPEVPEVPEVPEDVNISPTPDFDIHDAHDPPSADSPSLDRRLSYYTDKEFNILQGCLDKVETGYCGAKILTDMLDETTTPLTIECCRYLLKIGRDCHLVVAKYETIPQFAYFDPSASNAVPKSKYTWKDCVRRVESHIGAPISLE
ncbi:unnamed protein product [Brassica oleracea var. botrytis]